MRFVPSANLAHLKASETVAISNEAKRRKAAGVEEGQQHAAETTTIEQSLDAFGSAA